MGSEMCIRDRFIDGPFGVENDSVKVKEDGISFHVGELALIVKVAIVDLSYLWRDSVKTATVKVL